MSSALAPKERDAVKFIRSTLVHSGKFPTIRAIQSAIGYKSPHSATLVLQRLVKEGYVRKSKNGKLQLVKDLPEVQEQAHTVSVPLVGSVPAGTPFLAEENITSYIPISTKRAHPSHSYFLLKVDGDSMDQRGIRDGDLILVKQQQTAENGDIVVAVINDKATIKEFEFTGDAIILKPRSSNTDHKPIILTDDFLIQGVVMTPSLPDPFN